MFALITSNKVLLLLTLLFLSIQNVMPLSAGLLRSHRRSATPLCPPRLQVQYLTMTWTRVPDHALKVLVDRPNEHHGWTVQCSEPLQDMTLQIPDENRLNNRRGFRFNCTESDASFVFIGAI